MSTLSWPELMVEEFFRLGLDTYFVAPGSRSTPLVSAIARHPGTTAIVHYDERGTAYAAVGYARITGRPAAWVTTSGTAVANGLPAVIESSTDNIPVMLLTADRPPELQDTGANQTITQPGIFGSYVRWFFELPAQESAIDPAFVLTSIDHAMHRCVSEAGPVHLNCMYRKPLELSGSSGVNTPGNWIDSSEPYTRYEPVSLGCTDIVAATKNFQSVLRDSERAVILLGGGLDKYAENQIAKWATALRIPVFPDIGSRLRLNTAAEAVIPFWNLASSFGQKDSAAPDLLIQFGRGFVSTRWDHAGIKKMVVSAARQRLDPAHRVWCRITADTNNILALIQAIDTANSFDKGWLDMWVRRNGAIIEELDLIASENTGRLSEETAAHMLPVLLPRDASVLAGNSMPVRHMDRWGGISAEPLTPVVSRGTSGIDGTIAQAAGLGAGSDKPTAVILGDQSLLHDLNSLALAKKFSILIVVINNGGGRIFHRLPVAGHADIFDPMFVNAHGYTFENAAAQFDIRYVIASTTREFRHAVGRFSESKDALLIEIPIEYDLNEGIRQNLEDRISRALALTTTG